jgi:hypothetical protein
MFQYFKVMCTTKTHLRHFDYLGNVFDAWGVKQDRRSARR